MTTQKDMLSYNSPVRLVGRTGSGKTYLLKKTLDEYLKEQSNKNAAIFVFNDKGEYRDCAIQSMALVTDSDKLSTLTDRMIFSGNLSDDENIDFDKVMALVLDRIETLPVEQPKIVIIDDVRYNYNINEFVKKSKDCNFKFILSVQHEDQIKGEERKEVIANTVLVSLC